MRALFAVAASVASTGAAAQAPPAANPPTTIRVVADGNYPPYLFVGSDGKPQGYVADRWRLFTQHTGIPVELTPTSWGAAKEAVASGRADVIDLIYATTEREAHYDFSPPYVSLPVGIYVEHGMRGVHDIPSLHGHATALDAGDACARKLGDAGVGDLQPYPGGRAAVLAAIDGRQHVFCMDENRAFHYLKQYDAQGRFDRAFVLYTGQFGLAVRQGNGALLQTIERGMAQITPSEEAKLRAHWLERPLSLARYKRLALIAAGIVLAVALLMVLWVWLLRRAVAARTRELRVGERELREVLDASPYAVCVKDARGVVRDCNDRALALFGRTRDAMLGATDGMLFDARSVECLRALDAEVIANDAQRSCQLPLADAEGATRHLEVVEVPLHLPDGHVRGVLATLRDITSQLRNEREQRLAAAAFQTQEALAVLAPDRLIQRVNEAFVALTGHAAEDVVGRPPSILHSHMQETGHYERFWKVVARDGFWQGEQWIQPRTGQPKVVRTTLSSVKNAEGELEYFIYTMVDLSTEREAAARADRMTFFDPLTDLPNRHFLRDRMQQLLTRSPPRVAVLLVVDIDHFKRVNDLHGHTVGDHLLSDVARRLRGCTVDGCMPIRLSGGSFAVLVVRDDHDAIAAGPDALAAHAAAAVRALLAPTFVLRATTSITLTASIGWTHLQPGHGTADSVLQEAELAMYAAKAAGRDQVLRFSPVMQQALVQREALARDLRQAVADEALTMHLQPQVDRDGHLAGAEALARWFRAEGVAVSPGVFIPIAEEDSLILSLGGWMLRRACNRLASWAGNPQLGSISLAVNVSVRQFVRPDFVDEVRAALAATGANAERLKVEITESVVLDDLDEAAVKLKQLRDLGIRIALDDFGTGYSSMAYLSRLPLDQLKIDQSFVRQLGNDTAGATVARTIIGLGHGLGLEVIAEGVETPAQHAFLLAQGCDAFQGFLFARPAPLDEFEAMRWPRPPAAG